MTDAMRALQLIARGVTVLLLIISFAALNCRPEAASPDAEWNAYLTNVAAVNAAQEQRAHNLKGLLSSIDPPDAEAIEFTLRQSRNAGAYAGELDRVPAEGSARDQHRRLTDSVAALREAYAAELAMLSRSENAPVGVTESGEIFAKTGDAQFAVTDVCRELQKASDAHKVPLDMHCSDLITPAGTVDRS